VTSRRDQTLADFLQVSSRQSALGVATAQSPALTWVAKYAGFAVLKEALASPVVKLYTVPSESKTSLILTHTCHTDEKASDVLHLQRKTTFQTSKCPASAAPATKNREKST
jgi:hypothetical protein